MMNDLCSSKVAARDCSIWVDFTNGPLELVQRPFQLTAIFVNPSNKEVFLQRMF